MSSTLPLNGDGWISINSGTPDDGYIHLTDIANGGGNKLTIWGSCAGGGNYNGGNIVLIPGSKSGSGNDGGVGIASAVPKGLLQLAISYIVAHGPSGDTTGAKDRANINDAIGELAFGGTVYLQAGNYYLDANGISLASKNGINIIGAGMGATIIHIDISTETVGFDISNSKYCSIKDLSISSTQSPKKHTGIRIRSGSTCITVEKVEILTLTTGILCTSGTGINTFRDIRVMECTTGVQLGESGNNDNWASVNIFYGGLVNGCTQWGVWIANGASNVLNGLNINGNGTQGQQYGAVNFEDYRGDCGYNSIINCHMESNTPCNVRIDSKYNRIIGCLLGDTTNLISWASGNGADDGNIVLGNRFGNGSKTEVMLSNLGVGTTSPQTTLHTKGGSGTNDGTEHTGLILQGTSYAPNAGSQLQFDIGDGSNGAGYGAAIAAVDEGGYDTRLEFRTKNSAGHSNTLCTASDTKMSIDAEGAVGIGTTSVTSGVKLEVNGNIKVGSSDSYLIGSVKICSGSGSPYGVVSAPLGSLYLNTSGGSGTTLYVKESGGTGNTGWVAK